MCERVLPVHFWKSVAVKHQRHLGCNDASAGTVKI